MPQPSTALPTARHSRRKFDHDKAFTYWLNAEGQRRSYHDVAREFGVAEPSIVRAASVEDWPARAWGIEEEARKAADRKATKTVETRIRESLSLVDASKMVYARGLSTGKVQISGAEMAALLRVEQLLVGGATERFGPESEGAARSLATIEAELRELDPAQVDALVAADAVVAERVLELDAVEVEP